MRLFIDWVMMFLLGLGTGWITMGYMQLAKCIPEEEGEELE